MAEVRAATLREVVEALAPLDRTPCSPGERRAAEWLADRLRVAGCRDVALEDEPSWGTFAPTLAGLAALGIAGGLLGLAGRGRTGALLSLLSVAGIVDEAQNGPRLVRRLVRRERRTVNVVAHAGDPAAKRTLVVLAHHDAAQTGVLFDQTLQTKIWELAPWLIEGRKTPPPQWWLAPGALALMLAGSLTGRRGLQLAGLAIVALGGALMADLARNDTVPGANDNLSACALIVALAEMLREEPVEGLSVWLVSCGAEETLQDGVRGFVARHAEELGPQSTFFLVPDTVGSPNLGLLEAEGPMWMEDYAGPEFRELIVACAREAGIELERGLRARASTDAIVPSRAGYPTAALISLTPWRALANYHLTSDTPENLDYGTVEAATRLTEAVTRALSAPRSPLRRSWSAHG
ncbi:MAG TPA: M28 family peptidase [Thermoleophilaceae bacterium]|nr:M28 family peptidase [Thermoleophilaceae bacterium]